jgi:hypothetical protein
MARALRCLSLLLSFTALSLGTAAAAHHADAPPAKSIRDILAGAGDFNGSTLPTVFRIGDERVDDLIAALDDSDPNVSRRAEKLLRYLGNPKGLIAVEDGCRKHPCFYDGPVPVPLLAHDYELIRVTAASTPLDQMLPQLETFVYSLALDGTLRSNFVLTQWLERSRKLQLSRNNASSAYLDQMVRNISESDPRKAFDEGSSLAQAVISNVFFLSSKDRASAKAKLFAKSSAGDKALLEIHVDRRVNVPERWYHVVIVRQDHEWHLVLVYMFAQG